MIVDQYLEADIHHWNQIIGPEISYSEGRGGSVWVSITG